MGCTGVQFIGVSAPGQTCFGDEIEKNEFVVCGSRFIRSLLLDEGAENIWLPPGTPKTEFTPSCLRRSKI